MHPMQSSIAIVGVGAVLPDALRACDFWENILCKKSSIREVPPGRWDPEIYYDPDPNAPDKTYSKIGAWVQGYEFPWKEYRIPPKTAASMDAGQHWSITASAEALRDFGYPAKALDPERTAVVLGTAMGGEMHYVTHLRLSFPEYAVLIDTVDEFSQLPTAARRSILEGWRRRLVEKFPTITEDTMPGELPNIIAGRVANVFNFRGPSFITDAACASSLAAIMASISLLNQHDADAVLTGGVDHNMGASSFIKFCKIGALSATGSRPFAEGADGFVMGEGACIFLMKRLEDAERDGDKVYAIIRGVGGSSDGKGKGITAPNPAGQKLAISRAWENAGLDPAKADYIEAHGTSTRVGDLAEFESLSSVFAGGEQGSIALGSVKSNIGHLKAAAGAAGLLKTVYALHHKILPPTINAEVPNSKIPFDRSPFYLIQEPRERSGSKKNDQPMLAGVSAYGFGGSNFHVVLEEYVPGRLPNWEKLYKGVQFPQAAEPVEPRDYSSSGEAAGPEIHPPLRGILPLNGDTVEELQAAVDHTLQKVRSGWLPPKRIPGEDFTRKRERLVVDFETSAELEDRLKKAGSAFQYQSKDVWTALQAQGIFRGSGPPPGKIAFLFPGQGSQYLNMGRRLKELSPVVAKVIADADRVMSPILGKPLSEYIYLDSTDPVAIKQAELALTETAVTQPAMLALDIALFQLLRLYGYHPDTAMGHSLGEYAALIAAGALPFDDAVIAVAARGREMSVLDLEDKGWMAAVMAPYEQIETLLKKVNGYVVAANINSHAQSVIGGASLAVEEAINLFQEHGIQAVRLPVSHAFHTEIVSAASGPLRVVLDRLHFTTPRLPLVANVTGEFYPQGTEAMKDILQKQVSSPVQWIKGMETLYASGVRTFVEVGPKKALKGFVDNVFASNPEVVSLYTNHPKTGELASFNQCICGLLAAGYAPRTLEQPVLTEEEPAICLEEKIVEDRTYERRTEGHMSGNGKRNMEEISSLIQEAIKEGIAGAVQALKYGAEGQPVYNRNRPPAGSVVISGTGLGLPGTDKQVMDPENAMRILRGEQFVDLIPERFRTRMLDKRVTRLVKDEDGNGRFETIADTEDVIKLAARPGSFDLAEEYGVPAKLIEALDITTQLAMAAGLDALREAGLPLVQTYRKVSNGKWLPDRWMLPPGLQDETGIIFASAFPGNDRLADEFERYYRWQNCIEQRQMLEDLRRYTDEEETLREIHRRIDELACKMDQEPYEFDRRFLFRILSMGHSQFAEYIGARGPNTQVNSACASTTLAIALAEDWIRSGRCQRVIVIAADGVTGDHLIDWMGAGFLAVGAAATDDRVDEAALPFDRRRHGLLMGMGACALVLESEDAVRQRGMSGIVELLSSEVRNSAYHATRLDVDHIAGVMDDLVSAAEQRFGLHRHLIAPETVFVSHETFTPARGGSASAEVMALQRTFGSSVGEVVVANTKGFTGHPMGVGIEDVIAVKILEHGIVPPMPNLKEIEPDFRSLKLSRGGKYPVQYALHLAAGFGSQIAMALYR